MTPFALSSALAIFAGVSPQPLGNPTTKKQTEPVRPVALLLARHFIYKGNLANDGWA